MPKPISVLAAILLATAAMAACDNRGSQAQTAEPTTPVESPAFPDCAPEDAAAVYPGQHWGEIDPDSAGWSDEGVRRALDAAQHGHWVAGMFIHNGRVIGRFGDLAAEYDSRSIRKTFVGAMIGQLVRENQLSLDATLAELGVDDDPPLSDVERTATVRQLMQSRSGVYRLAAFMTAGDREGMPRPGIHEPGEEYWYNNWGFNAMGTVVKRVTGEALGPLMVARLARPMAMQDFGPEDVRERYEAVSQHSAYRTWMSTRDRARFGLMMLRRGCWAGRQIVPADFVADSLYPHTSRVDADDFGYAWRSQEPIQRLGMTQRFYSARGNALQYIMLIPEWDLVVVLTTDMDRPGWMNMVRRRVGMEPAIENVREVLTALAAARPR